MQENKKKLNFSFLKSEILTKKSFGENFLSLS